MYRYILNKKVAFLILFISLFAILNACSDDEVIETNMSEQMIDFSFITQDEDTLSLDDLKGEWWLAYMSYTNCRTVCPRTTANMVEIQETLDEDGLHPHIVSFNVDPENDTAEDLKEYADDYKIDLDTWDFLTGYDFEDIQEISESVFKARLEKGAADQMSHSYMFYLVNTEGEVVKKYDGMSQDDITLLIADVKTVLPPR